MPLVESIMPDVVTQIIQQGLIEIDLGDVVVTQTAGIILALGERTFDVSVPMARVGDILFLKPKIVLPLGYGLRDFGIVTDGSVQLKLQCPLLALGASFTATWFGKAYRMPS